LTPQRAIEGVPKFFFIRFTMAGRYAETLGQYLRRERESRSVSLEELSQSTRISLPLLEALERDDFEFIPQQDFIPGFLRGLARHLGLDREEVLLRYRTQAELAARKEKFQQMPLFPGRGGASEDVAEPESEWVVRIPPREKKKIPWKILFQVAIVLMALGLSLYLHQILKETEKGVQNPPPAGNSQEGGGRKR
jgi:cytoskeletal protein RodZ